MATWEHGGGFSVNAEVRIAAHEREGLERLLRDCARPAFALDRLRDIDAEHLVYERVKPGPKGSVSLMLTLMQLLDHLAALIPPPRKHRHRTYGVLAPNSPRRYAVTALARPAEATPAPATIGRARRTRPRQSRHIARQRATSGRCFWRASMRCCRCCARSVAAR